VAEKRVKEASRGRIGEGRQRATPALHSARNYWRDMKGSKLLLINRTHVRKSCMSVCHGIYARRFFDGFEGARNRTMNDLSIVRVITALLIYLSRIVTPGVHVVVKYVWRAGIDGNWINKCANWINKMGAIIRLIVYRIALWKNPLSNSSLTLSILIISFPCPPPRIRDFIFARIFFFK